MRKFDPDSLLLPTLAWGSLALLLVAKTGLESLPNSVYLSYAGLLGIASSLGLSERRYARHNRLITQLQRSAMTDHLTGLGNRRLLNREMDLQIAQFRRHGLPFSILAADLDHFKAINDTWGHDAGDLVLKSFSKTATSALRDVDVLFRVGGEEFVAILPCTVLSQAEIAAERLRNAVENCVTQYGDDQIKVTISVGVASMKHEDSADSIVKRSDQAVYEAKSKGRNRFVSLPPRAEPAVQCESSAVAPCLAVPCLVDASADTSGVTTSSIAT